MQTQFISLGTVLLQDTAPYRSMVGFTKFPDAALPSNTTITVYAVQDLKTFLIPSPFLSSPHENTLFFMMGGTNDILSGIRVTHLEKMMLSEINKLNKKIPLCIGIPPLMTPLSITTGWQTHFAFTKNNKDLKNYGSFLKANCIDLDILFIDFSTAFPLDNAWYSDGIHPNEKGYSRFAEIAAPYMSI